jgi:hypothetical protein
MRYLGTSDETHRCPVTEISEQPVRFVGVGGLSALHAISFVLDRRPIREILLVDTDEDRLAFTLTAVRAAMAVPARETWLEQVYGVTPVRDEIRDWRDLDLTRFHERWQASGKTIQGPDDTGLLRISGTNGTAPTLVSLPWTARPGHVSVGWNFGALLEGAFPLPVIPVTGRLGRLSEVLEEWADDTVIWVADAVERCLGSEASGTPPDPDLRPRLRALDRLAHIRIYASAHPHDLLAHEVSVKDYEQLLVRQRPHFYTNEAIQRMRLGRTMTYVMHDEGQPRPGQLPESVLIGPEEFLRSRMTADTVVLHIMSQSPLHGDAVQKGLASSRRLLVLEHNFHTQDRHLLHNEGRTLPDVRTLVGTREEAVRWCFGARGGLRRNFVAAFAGHLSS